MGDSRPIGVFDSGLGGLTVLKEIHALLPKESTVYLGDTARVPYGNRSTESIIKFTIESINTLLRHQVKAVIIACGTSSSVALKEVRSHFSLPLIGVIEPASAQAAATTNTNQVGIIGTNATINSKSFETKIKDINPNISTFSTACPLFVPIIEEGIDPDHPIVTNTIKYYLQPFSEKNIDTLVLGCTHYPLIATQIQSFLPTVKLINVGVSLAHTLKQTLQDNHLNSSQSNPRHSYFVTDKNINFNRIASNFLNKNIEIQLTT